MSLATSGVVLEPAAQELTTDTAQHPFLFELSPPEGRKALDDLQSAPGDLPTIDEEWIMASGGPSGEVKARIVKPRGATGTLPVVLYIHGAGWVFGDAHTHDRLVRELAVGVHAVIVFPEYDRSPEARYPVAIEQNYAVARWVIDNGPRKVSIHPTRRGRRFRRREHDGGADADGQGTWWAKLAAQLLFYPVTDANFDTSSYEQFAEGYYLRRDVLDMQVGDLGVVFFDERDCVISGRREVADIEVDAVVFPVSHQGCVAFQGRRLVGIVGRRRP